MFAFDSLVTLLWVFVTSFAAWGLYDLKAAFDNKPESHTASDVIVGWKHKHPILKYSLLGAILSPLILVVLLFLHLWLEVI